MRPRHSLIDLFSTFLQFEADSVRNWVTDARLRRSMQRCLEAVPEEKGSESFWATYWHKRWKTSQNEGDKHRRAAELATNHLSAYLQETCYWSVKQAMLRLDSSQYRLSDCFQVAIAEIARILNACDLDQLASLKTYATTAFRNIVRDHLRSRQEVSFCSDWGLLLKLSRKQLREALQTAGFTPVRVEQYVLAWKCFEAVYLPRKAPGLRQLAAPDRETWMAVAQRYNSQRQQLDAPGDEISPELLEKWLLDAAKRSRAYLYPAIGSLNTPKPGYDDGEVQDDLADSRDTLLTELIAQEDKQERQTQTQQMLTVLTESLATLDQTSQTLLQLYYQEGKTQQQIAKQLDMQQYTVSRRLAKLREGLLLALTRWSEAELHILPTSTVVKSISTLLDEWLQTHYSTPDRSSVGDFL